MSEQHIDVADWLLSSDHPYDQFIPLPPTISNSSLAHYVDLLENPLDNLSHDLNLSHTFPPPTPPRYATPHPRTASLPLKHLSTNILYPSRGIVKQQRSASNNQLLKRVKTKIEIPMHDDQHISRRPADQSRQRHNEMMRQNRSRFNNKFKQLTQLLDHLKDPSCQYKPMKNKIQILERAIHQYAQMQSKKDRFQSQLTFLSHHQQQQQQQQQSPQLQLQQQSPQSQYLNFFATVPTLSDACNVLIQHMCATANWKYGEAWIRNPVHTHSPPSREQYQLCCTVISNNNMPDTRQALASYAQKSNTQSMDPYLLQLSTHQNPIWIPDISSKTTQSSRANHAKQAAITTMFAIPIYLTTTSLAPDAIITLMHVNDELLSYSRPERPYDSNSMIKLLDLVAAIVKSRSAC